MPFSFFIITLLLGGMFSFLGWVIKSQNVGDMVNGFNNKKDDKEKVPKIMGNNLLFLGICIILIGIINLFLHEKYSSYSSNALIIVILIIIVKATYETNKYGKK